MTQGPSKGVTHMPPTGTVIGSLDTTRYGIRFHSTGSLWEYGSLEQAEEIAHSEAALGLTVSVVKIVEVAVYKGRP